MNHAKNSIIVASALLIVVAAQSAQAQGSTQHFSKGAEHSSMAVGHSVVGGAKLVSGVVATPLIAVGASGQVSQQAGEALWDIANEPIGTPLPVSDEAFTAGPSPAQAIQE